MDGQVEPWRVGIVQDSRSQSALACLPLQSLSCLNGLPPFAAAGTLLEAIQDAPPSDLSGALKMRMALNVARGMAYLHNRPNERVGGWDVASTQVWPMGQTCLNEGALPIDRHVLAVYACLGASG